MSDLLAHFTAWRDTSAKELVSPNRLPAPSAGDPPASFETTLAAANETPMEGEAFTAWDLLDIINPLQHIPLVSDAYRAITGDTIRPEIQLAGSTAVGGVLGFASQLGSMVFEAGTGQSVGDAVMTALIDTPASQPKAATATAQVEPVEVASLPAAIIAQHHAPISSTAYPSVSQAFATSTAYDAYQRAHEAPTNRSNQIL